MPNPATDRERLLFTGPFHADHRARARDVLRERADGGARDLLYIVASATAKRAAIGDLVRRRCALFGVRVVTLRTLGAELARRARVAEPAMIDDVMDDLLVEQAVRAATGSRFDGSTPVRGLASKVASTIDLLERNGGSSSMLAPVVDVASPGEGAQALLQTWRTLELSRARHGRTPAQSLAASVALLGERPLLLNGLDLLLVEDVPALAALERALLAAVIANAPGWVVAAYGHAPQLPDAPSSVAVAHVRAMAGWREVRCEPPITDGRDYLGRMFTPAASRANPESGANGSRATPSVAIARLEAAGDVGEVRLAARVVRRHLDNGVKPGDIALVVHGGADRYRELVHELFGAAGIPVAATRPRAVADTGIGSVLLQLLALAAAPDRATRQASLAVARTPHLDLRTHEADRLERQVTLRGYLGLDGWDALALEALGGRAVNRVNRLKRAVAGARRGLEIVATPDDAARVVRQLARDLRLVGNAYFARRRKARGPGADDSLATRSALAIREDNQAWEEIEHALDHTVPALLAADRARPRGGRELADAWLAMLGRVMRSVTVVAERAPAEAVQLRGSGPGSDAPARVVIVLGLLEKCFPRQPRQDPLLDDAVRRRLRQQYGWSLITSDEAAERERECFLRAVASATEALYLSCAATDSQGRPAVRSFFIDDLTNAVGHDIPVERSGVTTAVAALSDAASPSELLAALSHDIWQQLPRVDAEARRTAAFRALDALARRDRDLSVVRHGRRVTQRPKLDAVLPAFGPNEKPRLSASQLKSIAHCTYKHFVEKVLVPTELVAPEYDALNKGSLIHDAIMHWSAELRGWDRGEVALDALSAWVRERVERWSPAERGSARARQAASADCERLDEFIRHELALLEVPGIARPLHAELAFGEELGRHGPRDASSRVESFELTVETTGGPVAVNFRGSMDRVDVLEVDGVRYGVVIDYKTGQTSERYAADMMKGHDLQLRLYLMVLEQFWGVIPVGALYLGFGDGVRRGAMRAEFASRFAGIEDGPVKLLDADAWAAFRDATPGLIAPLVDRLVRRDIVPAPRDHDCGFCELTPICRYERWSPEAYDG